MGFKRTLLGFSALMLSVLLAACGGGSTSSGTTGGTTGGSTGSSSSTGNPADGAKSFLTAIYTGQGDPMSFACSAAQAVAQQMQTSFRAAAANATTVDVSGLTFTTQNQSGDTAQVVVSGTVKMTVSGNTVSSPFAAVTFQMKNENGWKFCGQVSS